jgi:predicted DNA-binding protein (MmcQ/YjbR family)
MSKSAPKQARDNRANQLNPEHPAYYLSRGHSIEVALEYAVNSKSLRDNRSRQLHSVKSMNKDSDG